MRRGALFTAVLIAAGGCDRPAQEPGAVTISDSTPVAVPAAGTSADAMGAVAGGGYRRERRVDLTGDGRNETVIAAAAGAAYDSLDVSLTIVGERGDTLWHGTWPSLLYFEYDPVADKADTTVMRIVRDHLEQLVEPEHFTMSGGLPPVLRRGGDADAVMREAIRYHLAELDYRLRADLTPADATPASAVNRIAVQNVPPARVNVVLAELRTKPSFMYYAGGEATYVIAWSDRENAFVRMYSCC
jgi:hypothetical protein